MIEDTGERLIPELHKHSITYGEHLSRYMSVTDIVKGKNVLDAACGVGYGTQLLAKSASSVTGVDYSEDAIAYAKEHYSSKNVSFDVSDATKMPYKDASFDVVISFETIEHIHNPTAFVKEVRRVLKPGGVFVVSTPNDDEFTEGNVYHVHEFDLKEMNKVVGGAFKNVKLYFQGTWFAAAVISQELFEQGGQFKTDVVQMYEQPKEKAIFYIAVCSDGDLPELNQPVSLADRWSGKEDQENDLERKKILQNLNDEKEAINKQRAEFEAHSQELGQRLNKIHSSYLFKILNRLTNLDR